MQLQLKRTGGIINFKKLALTEVDITETELANLVSEIKRSQILNTQFRDSTSFFLVINNESIPIDLTKIPEKYKAVFEELISNLKPEKQ